MSGYGSYKLVSCLLTSSFSNVLTKFLGFVMTLATGLYILSGHFSDHFVAFDTHSTRGIFQKRKPDREHLKMKGYLYGAEPADYQRK